MTHYVAILDRALKGYGVTFPDAPGCTSAGHTLEEAARNAVEALRDWVEVTEEAGVKVAPPRTLDEVLADADVKADLSAGSVIAVVPLVARRGRTQRVQVTMDEGTLTAIDEAARKTGETRSGFLARAAMEAITGH